MADLFYFDQAILYNKQSDDIVFRRWFKRFLNASPSKGGAMIPDELPKTEREVIIIEWAKNRVKECMRFFKRSKLIDIPLSMIYVVAPGEKTKYSSLFLKGIVVERSGSDCLFAAEVFQEIFCRMCFSLIIIGEDKRISYVNGGLRVLKKGIASLLAGEFVKASIAEGALAGDFSEEAFDRNSEGVFNLFLEEFYSRNKTFSKSKEEYFNFFVEAIVNGTVFPAMMRDKKLNSAGSVSLNRTETMEQKVPSTD